MRMLYETKAMKNNIKNFRVRLLSVLAPYLFFICIGENSISNVGIILILCGFYAIAGRMLLSAYLTYHGAIGKHEHLADIVKFHNFDTKKYFCKIAKMLAVLECGMAVGNCISQIIYKEYDMIPITFALLIVPVLEFIIAKKYFQYRLEKKISIGEDGVISGVRGIVTCIVTLGNICGFVFLGIILYAIIHDNTIMKSYDDSEVVYQVFYNRLFPIWMIFMGIFVSSLQMYSGKKLNVIIPGLLVVIILVSMVYIDKNNNTIIANDKIITSSHGEKEEYSFDEVKTFEIFYKGDEIGFRLTMNDDREIDVVDSSYSNTDAWGEKYYSLYNYVADMAEVMLQKGAKGNITDVEKLREHVRELDKECIDGVEKMIDLLASQNIH